MLSFRSTSLPLASIFTLALALGGCTQGVGATCQYNEDCGKDLSCCNGGLPRATSRGTCQRTCDEVAAPDAATPPASEDAWSMGEGSEDASIDTDAEN